MANVVRVDEKEPYAVPRFLVSSFPRFLIPSSVLPLAEKARPT
jgi:hypothetical protein